MVEQTSLVLHTIKVFGDYFFDAETETLFDACNYSMFKYGAGTVARQYGYALCRRFVEEYSLWFGEQDNGAIVEADRSAKKNGIYITCSPFKVAPTASHAVALYFHDALNKVLVARGLPTATLFKIDRLTVLEGDYGKLSEASRRDVMGKNSLSLPQHIDLRASNLIIIDDIRITGSHEEAVLKTVMEQQPQRICKMFVALFEQGGKEKAHMEAKLNNTIVKNLTDLNNVIKGMRSNYILNARVCKFLLSQPDIAALKQFLVRQPIHLVKQMYDYMLADGYSEMSSYKSQFEVVKNVVRSQSKSSQTLVGLGLSMIGGTGIFCGIES